MITAILWVELLIELGIASLITARVGYQTHPPLLVFGGVLTGIFMGLRVGAVVVTVTLARLRGQPPLSLSARSKLLWNESISMLRFCWLMLTECGAVTPRSRSLQPDQTLVVLLHGVFCNRGIWRPVPRKLGLHASRIFLAPNLGPVSASLETQARRFAQWLDASVGVQPDRRVVVVGYSMGGVIARICIEQRLAKTAIHQLICIGSPHAGSEMARWLPSDAARDLRVHSLALSRLNNASKISVVNIYSRHDNLVVPFHSAHLPQARNIAFDGIGHMSLIYSPRIHAAILDELALRNSNLATNCSASTA